MNSEGFEQLCKDTCWACEAKGLITMRDALALPYADPTLAAGRNIQTPLLDFSLDSRFHPC